MFTKIIVYYHEAFKNDMKNFLFSHVIREYMELGDTVITENYHTTNSWQLRLHDAFDNDIDIYCIPFIKDIVTGNLIKCDCYYIQDFVYEHGDQETVECINQWRMYTDKNAPIYIFNREGVVSEWSTD